MNRKTICILTFLLLSVSQTLFANWNVVSTGINDNLNAVLFWNTSNGMMAGDQGVYYTTTGGTTPGSWTRFAITTNSADSLVYSHTKFTRIASAGSGIGYLCGWDSIQDRPVIFKVNSLNLTYSIKYVGPVGARLNNIISYAPDSNVYAIGDSGMILRSYHGGAFTSVANSNSNNLYAIGLSSSTRLAFAGDQIYMDVTETGTQLNMTTYYPAGCVITGTTSPGTVSYCAGNDLFSVSGYGSSLQALPNYDFGPLNARKITTQNGGLFLYVATDHGIFASSSSRNFLEYQPSSNGWSFNDVIFLTGQQTGYACGDQGVFMYTTDAGGDKKPYCSFTSNGGCVNGNLNITGNPGTGTSCKWLINSVQASTSCNFAHIFPAPGVYTISYIVWNSAGLYDTATHDITVVNAGQINLPVTLSDSILCQQEPVTLTIQNTQQDYTYQLFYGLSTVLGSGAGNGGTLAFTSIPISASGNYFIKVNSALAQCSSKFTDTIKLVVEHTHSSFHGTLFNAEPGEPVSFNATSTDAQNFQWTFGPNASISSSSVKSPSNISFGTLGATQVQLISWSDNGCYDSISSNGPFIYNEPVVTDSCWSFNLDCNDPTWTGFYVHRINTMIPAHNGFIVCGTAFEDSLKTRYGQAPPRTTGGGGYLAKYSKNGTIKFAITSIDSLYQNQTDNRTTISCVTEDRAGNMYVSGHAYRYVKFTDNAGEVHNLSFTPAFSGRIGFVAKFDSLGRYIWATQLYYFQPLKLKLDNNQDLVLVGHLNEPVTSLYYDAHGTVDTLVTGVPFSSQNERDFILKIDTAGILQWFAYVNNQFVNRGGLSDISFDASNNLYVSGGAEYWVRIYSAGNYRQAADSFYVNNGSNLAAAYVVKYNTNGIYQWNTLLYHANLSFSRSIFIYALAADPAGHIYITGNNQNNLSTDTMYIRDPSNNISKYRLGAYFLAKLNTSGSVNWLVGNQWNNQGTGMAIWPGSNEINVLGKNVLGVMTSTDSLNQSFSSGPYDLFIASYDTAGKINYLTKTGNNTHAIQADPDNNGTIMKDADGNIYLATDIRSTIPAYSVQYFQDSILANEWDGIVAKMGRVPCQVFGPVATFDTESSGEIQMFPNPVSDELTLHFPPGHAFHEIWIRNILGQVIYKATLSGSEIKIPFHAITESSGLFLVTAKSAKEILTKKIVYFRDR